MAGEIKRISEKYTKTITNVRENMEISINFYNIIG
jgi:hypothetical protein